MNMKMKYIMLTAAVAMAMAASAQTSFSEATEVFVIHSSGNHIEMGTDGGGWIEAPTKSNPQKLTFIPDGQGYYNIKADGEEKYGAF